MLVRLNPSAVFAVDVDVVLFADRGLDAGEAYVADRGRDRGLRHRARRCVRMKAPSAQSVGGKLAASANSIFEIPVSGK